MRVTKFKRSERHIHVRSAVPLIGRSRSWVMGLLLLLAGLVVSGCHSFDFYRQAIKGQCQIISQQQKIDKLLENPWTPAQLKERLRLIQSLRAFAQTHLHLPVDGHYRTYADLHRQFVVWNVEAAPEFSLQAKSWWYPLVGSLAYRGYFSESGAKDYAARLQQKSCDVYVGGVTAYSTLNWFKDPVLNTFIFEPETDLAETLFHELGHQRVFAHGDTDFNEAFATTVGQEGTWRWLRAQGNTNGCARYLRELRRTDQFVHLIARTRERLATLYHDEPLGGGSFKAAKERRPVAPEQLRWDKRRILDSLHQEYSILKTEQWDGDSQYDEWFAHGVNNAKLNSVAAYYDLVPGFQHLLESNGGNLERFYRAASQLAKQPKSQRDRRLAELGNAPQASQGRKPAAGTDD